MPKVNSSKILLPLVLIYFLLVMIFSSLSYKFFINDFIFLEKEQNKTNISSFLNLLENDLIALKQTTKDYSSWDNTYEFIDNKNEDYIYDNFREDTNTLENLDIDSFIFVNAKHEIVYINYNKRVNQLGLDKKVFEKKIIEKLKDTKELSTLLFDEKFFYIVKSSITKSDHSEYKGDYLISVKLLDSSYFSKKIDGIFEDIDIVNKQDKISYNSLDIDFEYLKNLKIYLSISENEIVNHIMIYDDKDNYQSTFITKNKNSIISQGKNTIVIFNIIVAIILFFIFLVIYQKERLILKQNEILNDKVDKRTKQLTKVYKNLKEKNKELYKLAHTDSLTGIRNRADYFKSSIELLKKSNTENKNFAVLMIDIDHFKKINDSYGHNAGDKVLVKFSKLVSSIIEKDFIFGRLGGEEFAITIYDKDDEFIYQLSEKIRLECLNFNIKINDVKINFTISMGVVFKENSKESIDEILHKADVLLYKAKNEGRNRVVRTNR